jgi:hypothetical protein
MRPSAYLPELTKCIGVLPEDVMALSIEKVMRKIF